MELQDSPEVDPNATEAATGAAVAVRPGCKELLTSASAEWRRQKGVQDATTAARKLLLAETENEVDTATAGSPSVIAVSMSNPESVVVAGPPTDLAELVAIGLAGYEVPSTMSDSGPSTVTQGFRCGDTREEAAALHDAGEFKDFSTAGAEPVLVAGDCAAMAHTRPLNSA